jgi:hypothetical protein
MVEQGGIKQYTTGAIDSPELFLWIREHRFPQVTAKDFRLALRQMCRPQRPGYKASPLSPDLLQILRDRIAAIGRRAWSCQVTELMSETDDPSTSPCATPAVPLTNNAASSQCASLQLPSPPPPPPPLAAASGAAAAAAAAAPEGLEARSNQQAQQAQQAQQLVQQAHQHSTTSRLVLHHPSSNGASSSSNSSSQHPSSARAPRTAANALKRKSSADNASASAPVASSARTRETTALPSRTHVQGSGGARGVAAGFSESASASLPSGTMSRSSVPMRAKAPHNVPPGVPLDDFTFRGGMMEFGFGWTDIHAGGAHDDGCEDQVDDSNQHRFEFNTPGASLASSSASASAMAPAFVPLRSIGSLLPQTVTQEIVSEFSKMTALLRHVRFNDVPVQHLEYLEAHFTKQFAPRNVVSFIVQRTNRFETGEPDVHANRQAEQLFGVGGLTQVQHILMGVDSMRTIISCLAQAAQVNADIAFVPGLWASTRDEYGNPCPRHVDMWLPRAVFNGNCFMIILAPRGAASLQHSFQAFLPSTSTRDDDDDYVTV